MTFHLPATPEAVAAYCADPSTPNGDQIQIHDLYDAAAGDRVNGKPVRFEDSEFTRLAHVCEACGQPMPKPINR
jgi:hypothetical protein